MVDSSCFVISTLSMPLRGFRCRPNPCGSLTDHHYRLSCPQPFPSNVVQGTHLNAIGVPPPMTMPAKLWILIVLVSGESLCEVFYIICQLFWCLLMTSMPMCGHHMAEHGLGLAMIVWPSTPKLDNIVVSQVHEHCARWCQCGLKACMSVQRQNTCHLSANLPAERH